MDPAHTPHDRLERLVASSSPRSQTRSRLPTHNRPRSHGARRPFVAVPMPHVRVTPSGASGQVSGKAGKVQNADALHVGLIARLGGLDDVEYSERTDVRLLRPCEVVEMLGVSRSWLYDAAKSGRIPCVRLGGEAGPVRFRPDELQAWLEASRVVAAPAMSSVLRRAARQQSLAGSRQPSRRPAGASWPAGQQLGLLPPAADV